MGLFDSIKNIMTIPEEDEFEEEIKAEREETRKTQPEKRPEQPRVLGGKPKSAQPGAMQVVLVKPDRFEDVTSIADHLNAKKTVVLNLEVCDRDVSRRIIDFLSGAAYANHGSIRKVAVSTFMIVPTNVDVMGELMTEDFDENRMYF